MPIDPRTPIDDWERVGRAIERLGDRVLQLERPTGTEAYQSVSKLAALVSNIQAQLDAYNANRYTNAQIDSQIANPPTGSNITGNLTVSGNGSFTGGALSVNQNVTVGGRLVNVSAYTTIVGATRQALWVDSNGFIGRT